MISIEGFKLKGVKWKILLKELIFIIILTKLIFTINLTKGRVEGDEECVTGGACCGADGDSVRGDHRKQVQGCLNGGGITGGLQGTCQKQKINLKMLKNLKTLPDALYISSLLYNLYTFLFILHQPCLQMFIYLLDRDTIFTSEDAIQPKSEGDLFISSNV